MSCRRSSRIMERRKAVDGVVEEDQQPAVVEAIPPKLENKDAVSVLAWLRKHKRVMEDAITNLTTELDTIHRENVERSGIMEGLGDGQGGQQSKNPYELACDAISSYRSATSKAMESLEKLNASAMTELQQKFKRHLETKDDESNQGDTADVEQSQPVTSSSLEMIVNPPDPKLGCSPNVIISPLYPEVEKILTEQGTINLDDFNDISMSSPPNSPRNRSRQAEENETRVFRNVDGEVSFTEGLRNNSGEGTQERLMDDVADEPSLGSLVSSDDETFFEAIKKKDDKATTAIRHGNTCQSDSETDFEDSSNVNKKQKPTSAEATGLDETLNVDEDTDIDIKPIPLSFSTENESDDDVKPSPSTSGQKTKKLKKKRKAFFWSDSSMSDDLDSSKPKRNSNKKNRKKKPKKDYESDEPILLSVGNSSDSNEDFKDSPPWKNSNQSKRTKQISSNPEVERTSIAVEDIPTATVDTDFPFIPLRTARASIPPSTWTHDAPGPSNAHRGRRNIRRVWNRNELAQTTIEAERAEEERITRLTAAGKLVNPDAVLQPAKLTRLVLDPTPPGIEVDRSIVKHLKSHQVEGIKFMFNSCFESVQMIKADKFPGGCILAHCMGLGKTLQSVALMHTLLSNPVCGIRTILVLCPNSTAKNWYKECKYWTKYASNSPKLHKLFETMKGKTVQKKLDELQQWQDKGGIGILHYEAFRVIVDPKEKHPTLIKYPKLRDSVQQLMLNPGPDLIICDEGHLIKNPNTALSLAVSKIETPRRIILTGTPLQNNLKEYHTMVNFVKPNLLGEIGEFSNRFAIPIKNGQHSDSKPWDIVVMKMRSHVLHRRLKGCVQRYDYSVLATMLPPKHEYIVYVKLTKKQEELYEYYLDHVIGKDSDYTQRRSLLRYFAELVKVWSHPKALVMKRSFEKENEDKTKNRLGRTMKRGMYEEDIEDSLDEDAVIDEEQVRELEKDFKVSLDKNRSFFSREVFKWWESHFNGEEEMIHLELSGKLIILQQIIQACQGKGDKLLVFSQFLSSLDIMEELLEKWDQNALQQPFTTAGSGSGQRSRWRKNVEYYRIDGSTKTPDRHKFCEDFNETRSKARLVLISTKAGSLGINLYGANRVVIFDSSWNPSQDKQSIFRVYRFGQTKPCFIYRLVALGTMEEKILRRQITKLSLASRVVDEHQVSRHYTFDDVYDLYVYEKENHTAELMRRMMAVPEDQLLADLLLNHGTLVRKYEKFDSLLENRADETLTNEEKEKAWEDYRLESEKKKLFVDINNPFGQQNMGPGGYPYDCSSDDDICPYNGYDNVYRNLFSAGVTFTPPQQNPTQNYGPPTAASNPPSSGNQAGVSKQN